MKAAAVIVSATLILGIVWAVIEFSPLLLNSRIERLRERNLPKITIEKGGIVYCRMKADDFRFPLPPGSEGANPVINSGGFDTIGGSIEARFQNSKQMTSDEYGKWLAGKVPVGGQVAAQSVSGGLLIKFHYFGDR
jgi:hypothetical protein